jgi:GntR family transcriptional regulator/MocR family aminotransferase
VRLPAGVSATVLAARTLERGVLIEPGDVFFLASPAPAAYVRLGYQSITVDRIAPGIRLLAEVLAELQREAAHAAGLR